MTELTSSTFAQSKLSQEPGFVSVDLNKQGGFNLPIKKPGLLAFLYSDGNWESVIKVVMLDDLSNGFFENRPFSGRANKIAYYVFPEVDDFDQRSMALRKRLQLYAQVTERYNAPQTVWGR